MFNLIRRISNGVILRPDRPWADDATSNAPTKGKKRRLSYTERNLDPESAGRLKTKKLRGQSDAPETPEPEAVFQPQQDEKDVKEVTKGVQEVELNEPTTAGSKKGEVKPESVPLPEEDDTAELEDGTDAASEDIASSADGEGVADGPSESESEGQELEGKTNVDEEVVQEKAEETETQVPAPETKKTEGAHAEPAP